MLCNSSRGVRVRPPGVQGSILASLISQSPLRPIRSLKIDAAHGPNHSGSLILGTEQAKH
jgi:hypothetical protein